MSLHHSTMQLVPATNTAIPATQYIYQQETFLTKPPKFFQGEAFAQQGKELITPYFSFQHGGQEFVPVAAPSMTMNYGTYIYNIVDGYQ